MANLFNWKLITLIQMKVLNMSEENKENPVVLPPAQPEAKAQKPAEIEADINGLIVGKTLGEQYRVASVYAKSGVLPKHFDTAEKVLTVLHYCRQMNLPPLVAMRQIMVVNNTPTMWGDLPLALVKKSGKLQYIKEFLIDTEGNEISLENKNMIAEASGAICITKRVGDASEIVTSFSIKEAQDARLFDKTGSVWKVYPKRMLQMRARSQNLKDNFPDVLHGVAISEYDDISGDSQPTSKLMSISDAEVSTKEES
jgi:hypothetical protein